MNKIPCTSQNMEPKTLPADVCIFGWFGQFSPAAFPSANCRFDSRVKWWIHVLSIVTHLCYIETVANNALNHQCIVVLFDCEQMQHPISTRLAHFQMFMQNDEYTAFWYLQLLCYITQLQFMMGQNKFGEFLGVFWDNCRIWVNWPFSIICVCMTAFKVSIPPLNCCFIGLESK